MARPRRAPPRPRSAPRPTARPVRCKQGRRRLPKRQDSVTQENAPATTSGGSRASGRIGRRDSDRDHLGPLAPRRPCPALLLQIGRQVDRPARAPRRRASSRRSSRIGGARCWAAAPAPGGWSDRFTWKVCRLKGFEGTSRPPSPSIPGRGSRGGGAPAPAPSTQAALAGPQAPGAAAAPSTAAQRATKTPPAAGTSTASAVASAAHSRHHAPPAGSTCRSSSLPAVPPYQRQRMPTAQPSAAETPSSWAYTGP